MTKEPWEKVTDIFAEKNLLFKPKITQDSALMLKCKLPFQSPLYSEEKVQEQDLRVCQATAGYETRHEGLHH